MGVIILTGKSCAGKDTLRGELEKLGYENIVSYTSRSMRIGEREGREYKFINKETFINMINNNEMIEYRTYNTLVNNIPDTWYYGLKKESLNSNKDYVVVLDLNGVESFTNYYGKENCFVIYMCCPTDERKHRAINRGSFDNTEWERRVKTDDEDFNAKKLKKFIDFTLVNMSDDITDVTKFSKTLNEIYKQKGF